MKPLLPRSKSYLLLLEATTRSELVLEIASFGDADLRRKSQETVDLRRKQQEVADFCRNPSVPCSLSVVGPPYFCLTHDCNQAVSNRKFVPRWFLRLDEQVLAIHMLQTTC